jgi:hypothetical protein
MDFKNASWDNLVAAGLYGMVGPHQPLFEMTLVLYDRKPAALATEMDARCIRRLLDDELIEVADQFELRPIPRLMGRGDWSYKYALIRKGNEQAYLDIVAAFDSYPADPTHRIHICPTFDIALGRALGYREEDIARFLVHHLTREQFEAWQRGDLDILATK